MAAYWVDGQKMPLRMVALSIGVSHNTVRNWLIKFGLYESQVPNRGKCNKITQRY